jgi:peroxisomal 3,2-trans-enoyl-CoA isomerase
MSAQEAYQFKFVAKIYKNEAEIWEKLKEIDELPIGSIMANKKLIRGPMIKKLEEVNNEELAVLQRRFETDEAMEALVKFQMRKSKL